MILIADSGSTKTDWKCTDGMGSVSEAKTGGINPYYIGYEEIVKEIRDGKAQLPGAKIKSIFFYGAGCGSVQHQSLVASALKSIYADVDIYVDNDLLGAARALCQHNPGIACILGTGSGSCVFDGEKITRSIPSVGFILGDEGSGAYLGKQLVRDFIREEMPADLIEKIKEELNISKEIVLESVNRKPMPSKYLAGFSRFLHEHIYFEYIRKLVYVSFEEFVREYLLRYPENKQYKIHFVGSIASKFRKILKEVLEDHGLSMGNIEEAPINGLVEYHLANHKGSL